MYQDEPSLSTKRTISENSKCKMHQNNEITQLNDTEEIHKTEAERNPQKQRIEKSTENNDVKTR